MSLVQLSTKSNQKTAKMSDLHQEISDLKVKQARTDEAVKGFGQIAQEMHSLNQNLNKLTDIFDNILIKNGISNLQGNPPKCTGRITFVFFVIALSISLGSIQSVFGSMSTKTGIPPLNKTAFALDTKPNDGNITSLFLISHRERAKLSAAVPLFTEIQVSELIYF